MPTLAEIRNNVRLITNMLSPTQITDDQIKKYIDDYMLYEFPEELRTFNLRKKFTFYTEPYIGSYTTGTTTELLNFKNVNLTVHPPFYIAGRQVPFTQSPELFYGSYPAQVMNINVGTGDGVTTNYAGTLSLFPVIAGSVLFSSIRSNNVGLKLYDNNAGVLGGNGLGTINYVSGAYTLNFDNPPAIGAPILAQVYPYVATLPKQVLFFQDTFVLRPIPDQVYAVTFEVQQRPSALLDDDSVPELEEWAELITYETARSILMRYKLMEDVAKIEPECNRLRFLVGRRKIMQQKDQRTATIFSGDIQNYRWPNNSQGL